eukprot:CAMPEP_0206221296 /NCGR_PEP_ID=MMETSP0047_2-20121206/5334_1 /ASSEMBLY_ACC=CAM_ASM_000192 /TAXON_ID=195065 /ORGANISM="Chroomonas mesostigmatica_cf, Strain CCMP1168" /LENGTH=362 /DNA_ID=CAMNT_0053644011 /DNA_START=33 /DNA_END=1121 /DNA_ORIENTATION=+
MSAPAPLGSGVEVRAIGLKFDKADALRSARQIVAALIPHARADDSDTLAVTPVTGGITNALYKCTFAVGKGDERRAPVLVRVFGGEGMIDRKRDNLLFISLSKAGLGPKCLGLFDNGRVEEFLEGCTTMTCDDLGKKDIAAGIAVQLARVHSFEPPAEVVGEVREPALWKQLWDWHKQAIAVTFEAGTKEAEELQSLGLGKMEQELKELQAAVPDSCPLAFCNNDLLAGNVMVHNSTGRVHLIDFEYGGINYRGFDIANHFNEYAGGTDNGYPEYSKFPTEAHMREFCTVYVEELGKAGKAAGTTADEVLGEVKIFILVDHLYWGLWAVNMASTQGCAQFPYLMYSRNRLQEYWKRKQDQPA